MTDAGEWSGQTGESWAAEWRRTDRSLSRLTARLLARINDTQGGCVLDVGCGAGELSLAIAAGDPAAQVIGVDVSDALLAVARQRAAAAGLTRVRFQQADAARWNPPGGFAPDLLVSRHGVMFFDDPPAAFAHLAGSAAAGARLVFSCFREVSANPFFTEVAAFLPAPAQPSYPYAPGPFAFADPDRVGRLLAAAGWNDVAFEAVDFPLVAGAGEDPVDEALAYFGRIGPAARAIRELEGPARDSFTAALRSLAEAHCRDGEVALGAAAWIVTARTQRT
jgi:SAM-dependent methyltransferase